MKRRTWLPRVKWLLSYCSFDYVRKRPSSIGVSICRIHWHKLKCFPVQKIKKSEKQRHNEYSAVNKNSRIQDFEVKGVASWWFFGFPEFPEDSKIWKIKICTHTDNRMKTRLDSYCRLSLPPRKVMRVPVNYFMCSFIEYICTVGCPSVNRWNYQSADRLPNLCRASTADMAKYLTWYKVTSRIW